MSTTSFAHLVDDAAIFPPGNSPLHEAVRAHRRHRAAAYSSLVGPLLVSDARLPDLVDLTTGQPGEALPVGVVVSGGAGALAPAVSWAGRGAALDLRGIEIALRDSDLRELVHNTRRILAAVEALADDPASGFHDEVTVHVEVPRLREASPGSDWLAALDELAMADIPVKFRTGGADPAAFPSATELATCVAAALDRELRFKCTAGLHHAVRHRDTETGFEHHGFLNVLLATRASLDGAAVEDVAAVLEETDPDTVAHRAQDLGEDALASARRWFTSFGSCSVHDPIADLVDLGLLPHLTLEDLETS